MWARQSAGGASGMSTASQPVQMAALRASQPQARPMTSTTKERWCEDAVEVSASTALTTRCRALSAPTVLSVPLKSLSMEPTMPTAARGGGASTIVPSATS